MFKARAKDSVGAVSVFCARTLFRFRAMARVRVWFITKPKPMARTVPR
jgi:hypothetical protein